MVERNRVFSEQFQEDSGIDQLRSVLEGLNNVIQKSNSKEATQAIKEVESVMGEVRVAI